jgi:5-methylthioadenosine/S-adenosylhomocysteine deaminase
MRGYIGEHLADLGGPIPAGRQTWEQFRRKIENWPFSSLIKPLVYAHASDTVSQDLLIDLGRYAEEQDLPFHMHLSQTWGEHERVLKRSGKSPVRLAYEAGVVRERSLLVHLVSADRDDLKIIAEQGALVGLCPVSEIIYENLPDLKNFFELKVRIALGTDCAASNDGADLLSEARCMAMFARQSGFPLSAVDLGSMVLGEAAKWLAPDDLGSLDVGKLADLVCIKLGLEHYPWTRPFTNVFFSGVSRQVVHVMVNGQWVLWDRQLVRVSERDLIDEFERVLQRLRKNTSLPL